MLASDVCQSCAWMMLGGCGSTRGSATRMARAKNA
jgi:hypothetical protein